MCNTIVTIGDRKMTMTAEEKKMFEGEIYSVLNDIKGTDDPSQKAELNIYLNGIKTALEIMGYGFDYNDLGVRLRKF